jgi:hypothetical protein
VILESRVNGRRSIVLENAAARLVIDLLGGSFVDFHLIDQKLNPLVWNNAGDSHEPRQMSHFLCLDRWGYPSPAEAANGMPYHGEAGLVEWQVLATAGKPPGRSVQMSAELPLAGLVIHRTILFHTDEPSFTVTEQVINANALGCVFNMVQHPSIGPPFLDERTVVDCNAGVGFVIAEARPDPEQRSFRWPNARASDGRIVDMRRLLENEDPNVVAYVVDGPFGWTTAVNPAHELLIGYWWKTADYPWFNAWRRSRNGRPEARGLEFGTTGLDWPHRELVHKGAVFGRPVVAYLDAGESASRSFSCFLVRVPADYEGVGDVQLSDGHFILTERRQARPRRSTVAAA